MGSSLRQAHLIRAGEFCVRLGAPSSVSQAYCQIMSPMPWAAMLRYGPTLVASAARLLAAADSSKRREQDETITGRLDQLEIASAESARLLRDIAEQIQILAVAHEQTARKCRMAIVVAVAAAVVGVGEGIVAMVW